MVDGEGSRWWLERRGEVRRGGGSWRGENEWLTGEGRSVVGVWEGMLAGEGSRWWLQRGGDGGWRGEVSGREDGSLEGGGPDLLEVRTSWDVRASPPLLPRPWSNLTVTQV